MNQNKLRGRIRELFHTEKGFAEAMGMSSAALSARLNGRKPWTAPEIYEAIDRLRLRDDEIVSYFFTK